MIKFLVIDTETAGLLDQDESPLCYDIGFAVVDIFGKIYETHSYVVKEIFYYDEMMETAYYAKKIPKYKQDIEEGKRICYSIFTIKNILANVCKRHGIKRIFAHHASFDVNALNNTVRYITCSSQRFFFPYGVEIWDSLKLSRAIFSKNPEYIDFCEKNGYMTKHRTPRVRLKAEILYRYLTRNNDFIESHTGLEDVLIEKDIILYCLWEDPELDGKLF